MKKDRFDPFPPTPDAFRDGVQAALHNLTDAPARRRPRMKYALAAAVVAVFAFGTALAAGYLGGYVDWFGRRTADTEVLVEPTAEPSLAKAKRNPILDEAPEDEYWLVQTESDQDGQPCRKAFQSLEELNAYLAEKGAPFLRAAEIPEGYTFSAAECTFYFTSEAIDRGTVTEEALPDGATLRKFIPAAEEDLLVYAYLLQFRDERGMILSLDAELIGAEEGVAFGVDWDETWEVPEIPGMEHALIWNRGGSHSIEMIDEAVGTPDGYRDPLVWVDYQYPPMPCDAAWYSIYASTADKAELLAFAQSLK